MHFLKLKNFSIRSVAAVSLMSLAACGSIDPETELSAAWSSLDNEDYRAATVHASNVLQSDPTNADARVIRAEIARAFGDYRLAAAEYSEAVARGKRLEEVALNFAEALLYSGDDAVLQQLERVELAFQDDFEYWALRSEAAAETGNIDASVSALQRALSIGEQSARTLLVAARLALARGEVAEAEAILDQANSAFSEDPRVHEALARIFMQTEQLDQAGTEFQLAADLFAAQGLVLPQVPNLLSVLQTSLATGDTNSAEQTVERLGQIGPDSPVTLYAQGLLNYQAGQFELAEGLVQSAVNAQPNVPQFVTLLGAVHLARGNLGQAEQQLLRARSLVPGDPTPAKLLAETRLRQERPEAALDVLRPLLALRGAEDPQIGYLSGLASIQVGNREQGILYLEQALEQRPGDRSIQLDLARAYLAVGRSDEASGLLGGALLDQEGAPELETALLHLFAQMESEVAEEGAASESAASAQRLVNQFPDNPRALMAAAMYHLSRNQQQRADELLDQALRAGGSYTPALLLRVDRFLQEGNLDDAEAVLVEAQGRSTALETRLALADFYLNAGRYDDAAPILVSVAEEAPDHPGVNAGLGFVALAQGRMDEAVDYLSIASDAQPNQIGVALALAQAHLGVGAPGAARAVVLPAIERAPESLPLRVVLATAELRLGDSNAALAIADTLVSDFPDRSVGHIVTGEVFVVRREYDRAVGALERAFELESTWSIRFRLINALQLASREAEAIGEYLEAIEQDDGNVIALNNASWLLYEDGRIDEALSLAKRANELLPGNYSIMDTLGWILVQHGRVDEGVEILERASQAAPQIAEIRYHLAYAQVQAGRTVEARELLEALLDDSNPFDQREAVEELLATL